MTPLETAKAALRDAVAAMGGTRNYSGPQSVLEALAALEAAKEPEGWRLVPKQPTQAMCDRAREAALDWQNSGDVWSAMTWFRIYRAMLAAAPRLDEQVQALSDGIFAIPDEIATAGPWICLLCKSSRPGRHGTLDDRITPCPNGKAR